MVPSLWVCYLMQQMRQAIKQKTEATIQLTTPNIIKVTIVATLQSSADPHLPLISQPFGQFIGYMYE